MTNSIALNPAAQEAQSAAAPEFLKLKDAAGKFEAMLIAQMLKSARESNSGGSEESDQSGSAIMDMAEQHVAEMLGAQGALGIARMVVDKLAAPKPAAVR